MNDERKQETFEEVSAAVLRYAELAEKVDADISTELATLLREYVERFKKAHACDMAKAHGSAAAMRGLLERIRHEYGWGMIGCRTCVSSEADVERVSDLFEKQIDAALSAPARNCDRFGDDQDAQLAFLNEEWLISVDRDSMLEKDRFENWTEQMKTRYGRWLFAPAKGGDHA